MKIEKRSWITPKIIDLEGKQTEVGIVAMYAAEGTHFYTFTVYPTMS